MVNLDYKEDYESIWLFQPLELGGGHKKKMKHAIG